ncbi:MAG: MmcQ/YjbR family DNA-binding protein [Rudaea sp.]|uniref:MmcQ/YjbR family DNA-binding protein n=1 Tax=Rudaea sp. TaxID=2136325 RepID=UPI0039E337F9
MSLPETEERDHFGTPSFRVRGRIFAQLSAAAEEKRAVLKLSPADQAALIAFDPQTFSSIPQWGKHGWTYARLDSVDPALFRDALIKSWRQVAPKTLVAAFGAANR